MNTQFDKYLQYLIDYPIFNGLEITQIEKFLNNSCCYIKEYKNFEPVDVEKGVTIFVLKGKLTTYELTQSGIKKLVNSFSSTKNIFIPIGDKKDYPTVLVESSMPSIAMYIPTKAFTSTNPSLVVIQNTIQQNIIKEFFNMTEYVLRRSQINAETSARTKIVKYLQTLQDTQNQRTITLVHNRTELANYLSVDISTLLRELKAMKEEGIIDYDKKQITILKNIFQ